VGVGSRRKTDQRAGEIDQIVRTTPPGKSRTKAGGGEKIFSGRGGLKTSTVRQKKKGSTTKITRFEGAGGAMSVRGGGLGNFITHGAK